MSESAYEEHRQRARVQYCADCPATVIAEPVPVLGPFIGLVGAVLCSLAGALLLLAPFAFDYRQGARSMPRSSVLDLATGGGVLLIGLLTLALFGGSLRKRLRATLPAPAVAQEPVPESVSESAPVPEQSQPHEPEPQPVAAAAVSSVDPGGALRDLLTPLVAALAADLRARDNSVEPEGRQS